MDEQTKGALKEEALALRKLQSLGLTEEFSEYSNRLIKTVSEKMIYAFTSDNIKNIEDFYRIKGEIIARLQPIQEVFTAGALAEQTEKQLKEYYGRQEQ